MFTAYKELSQRSAPLEVSEADSIGLTTEILVAKAREGMIRVQRSRYTFGPAGPGWEQEEGETMSDCVGAIVSSVFPTKKADARQLVYHWRDYFPRTGSSWAPVVSKSGDRYDVQHRWI